MDLDSHSDVASSLSSVIDYFASRFVRCGQCAGAVPLSDVEGCIQRLDVQGRLSAYGELAARVSPLQVLIDFTAKAVRVRQQIEVLYRGAPAAALSVERVAVCRDGTLTSYASINVDQIYVDEVRRQFCELHPYSGVCRDVQHPTPLSEFVP